MCGDVTCSLAWRDKLKLRMLVNELSEQGTIDLLQTLQPVALVIVDMCAALNLDPLDALGSEMMSRINRRGDTRFWPVLTEAEDVEMVELAGIRQSDILDETDLISDRAQQRTEEERWHLGV